MCLAEIPAMREVITSAATAEVEADRPAICGTVILHCLDSGSPLRLSMPMLDAMLLLNSLKEIEKEFALEEWSSRLGCSLNAIDEIGAQLRDGVRDDNFDRAVEAPVSASVAAESIN